MHGHLGDEQRYMRVLGFHRHGALEAPRNPDGIVSRPGSCPLRLPGTRLSGSRAPRDPLVLHDGHVQALADQRERAQNARRPWQRAITSA